MRFLELIVLCVLTWLLAASLGLAQCGPGGCNGGGWQPLPPIHGGYKWEEIPGRPNWVALYYGLDQVGAYSFTDGFYYERKNGRWGGRAVAPITPPFGGTRQKENKTHFGLSPISFPGVEKIWSGTTLFSHGEAESMMTENLRDDCKAPHLTIIDRDPGRRKRLQEEIAISKFKGQLLDTARVQIYDPNLKPNKLILAPFHLEQDQEFQRSGVVVIAQCPTHNAQGTSKPERMYEAPTAAKLIDALRNVDPLWDPNRSPLPWLPSMPSVSIETVVIGALLLFVLGVLIARRSP